MNGVGGRLNLVILRQLLLVALLLVAGLLIFSPVYGAGIPSRELKMSDNIVNDTATYQLTFAIPSPQVLGSIQLQFCSNSPLLGLPCTAPSGFDVSTATLAAQSGETGFSIYGPGTNANTLVLARVPVLANAGTVSYTLTGVVNPSTSGAFYGRLQTFASGDASGPENDHGGLAMSINDAVQISTEVPPYLLFCGAVTIGGFDCGNASGDYINFGNLSTGSTKSATSQMLTATNAGSGFNISVFGSTMTSGNNIIAALATQDVSRPGVAQFGMNLVGNLTPAVGADPQGPGSGVAATGYDVSDFFKFVSGDIIATNANVDDFRKFTASYIINIPAGQPVGVYSTTLTYVCLANF